MAPFIGRHFAFIAVSQLVRKIAFTGGVGYSGQTDPSFPLQTDPSFSTPVFALDNAV
jgi:hypothetical protein